jgi:hypothetical protein
MWVKIQLLWLKADIFGQKLIFFSQYFWSKANIFGQKLVFFGQEPHLFGQKLILLVQKSIFLVKY